MTFKPGNNANPNGRPRGQNARVRLVDINRGLTRLNEKIDALEETLTSFVQKDEPWVDGEERENRRENRREDR